MFRGALWIVGEYVTELGGTQFLRRAFDAQQFNVFACDCLDIKDAVQEIRKVIGEIPILASEQVRVSEDLELT